HVAVGGHAGDLDGVGVIAVHTGADRGHQGAAGRGAGGVHVGAGEAVDRLGEHHRELDRVGVGGVVLGGGLIDRHVGPGGVPGDGVVGGGRGRVVVAGRVGGTAVGHRGDHVAVGGHAGDLDGVGVIAVHTGADRGHQGAAGRGAGGVHVGAGEAVDRLGEHHRELDRVGVGGVVLGGGLIDRHVGPGGVPGDGVVGGGRGRVVVAGRVGGTAVGHRGDHVAVGGHAGDLDGVGVIAVHTGADRGHQGAAGRGAGGVHVGAGEAVDRLGEHHRELDRVGVGGVVLGGGLIDRHVGPGGVPGDGVVGGGRGRDVVAGRVGGTAVGHRGDHVAVGGHDGDLDGVGVIAVHTGADRGHQGAAGRGAGGVHVGAGEAVDRLGEHHRELDRVG